jgi:5-deoxy-D-glucuronate isomerase
MKFNTYIAFQNHQIVGWICIPDGVSSDKVLEIFREKYGDCDSLVRGEVIPKTGEITILPPEKEDKQNVAD